ncbi:hypothetical protein D3C73_1474100 [compost metagenome]
MCHPDNALNWDCSGCHTTFVIPSVIPLQTIVVHTSDELLDVVTIRYRLTILPNVEVCRVVLAADELVAEREHIASLIVSIN